MWVFKAIVRIFLQASRNYVLEGGWNKRLESADRLGIFFQDGGCQRDLTLAFEGTLARCHLIEHRSKGEDVRAGVSLFAFDLLRRHVLNGADDAARRSQGT